MLIFLPDEATFIPVMLGLLGMLLLWLLLRREYSRREGLYGGRAGESSDWRQHLREAPDKAALILQQWLREQDEPRSVAAVLLALERPVARRLLESMDSADSHRLMQDMQDRELLGDADREEVFSRFSEQMQQPLADSFASLQQLSDKSRLPKWGHLPWLDKLLHWSPKRLAASVSREQNQVVAALLYCLPAWYAGRLLALFPLSRRSLLLRRIAQLSTLHPMALEALSEWSETVAHQAAGMGKGGEQQAVALLRQGGQEQAISVLDDLRQRDQILALRLRRKVLRFEDMASLAPEELQRLLKNVPGETLILSLKNSSQKLRRRILGALSPQAKMQLRRRLARSAPSATADSTEKARQEVLDVWYRLHREAAAATKTI